VQQAELEAKSPTIQEAKKAVAAATGAEAVKLKEQQPVPPEERAKHTDVEALLATGDLVQPPAGITAGELAKSPRYVAISDKQKDQLGELAVSNQTLGGLLAMADRLITARSAPEAWAQGLRLHAGAFTGENPLAKSYVDAKKGFLGPISRSVAKERGVLTDRDIGRIDSALSSFFDTQQSKDLKKAIVTDIFEVSRRASIAAVAGKSLGPFTAKMSELLTRLDRVHAETLTKSVPKDQRVILNVSTGQIGVQAKSQPVPKGWEEFK